MWGAAKLGLSWRVRPQGQRKDSQPVGLVRWYSMGESGMTGGLLKRSVMEFECRWRKGLEGRCCSGGSG